MNEILIGNGLHLKMGEEACSSCSTHDQQLFQLNPNMDPLTGSLSLPRSLRRKYAGGEEEEEEDHCGGSLHRDWSDVRISVTCTGQGTGIHAPRLLSLLSSGPPLSLSTPLPILMSPPPLNSCPFPCQFSSAYLSPQHGNNRRTLSLTHLLCYRGVITPPTSLNDLRASLLPAFHLGGPPCSVSPASRRSSSMGSSLNMTTKSITFCIILILLWRASKNLIFLSVIRLFYG
jgi:hypothetical protein